jgi:hypothetical protein
MAVSKTLLWILVERRFHGRVSSTVGVRVFVQFRTLLSGIRILRRVFEIRRFRSSVLSHSVKMKRKELTPDQVSSVPCPTCGVAVGEGCVLHSGAPRSEPHVDRKFAAAEAIEGE